MVWRDLQAAKLMLTSPKPSLGERHQDYALVLVLAQSIPSVLGSHSGTNFNSISKQHMRTPPPPTEHQNCSNTSAQHEHLLDLMTRSPRNQQNKHKDTSYTLKRGDTAGEDRVSKLIGTMLLHMCSHKPKEQPCVPLSTFGVYERKLC